MMVKKMGNRKITEKDINEIIVLVGFNIPIKDLAQHYKTTLDTMYRVIRNHKIATERKKILDKEKKEELTKDGFETKKKKKVTNCIMCHTDFIADIDKLGVPYQKYCNECRKKLAAARYRANLKEVKWHE